jgi:hypothetical protein
MQITSGQGGGLLGGLFGGKKSTGRKADPGGTTSAYGKKPAAAPATKGRKKPAKAEPEKWINGRSGPQLNPAWKAWKESQ